MPLTVGVIGASGGVGSAIVEELDSRGDYEVIAVSRHASRISVKSPHVSIVSGNASEPTDVIAHLKGVNVLICIIRFDVPAATILEIAESIGASRIIVVGGCANLLVHEGGPSLFNSPQFPKEFAENARPGVECLEDLKKINNFNWTYLSAPPFIGPGEKTGKYRTGHNILLVDDRGRSTISFEDCAVALVDEIENKNFLKSNFTVAY